MFKHSILTMMVVFTASFASAGELGSSGAAQSHINWQRQSKWSNQTQSAAPALTDPNQASRAKNTGSSRENNTGADSVAVAAKTALAASKVCSAGDWNAYKKVCTNAYYATSVLGNQVSIQGCKILKPHTNASCYGGKADFYFNGRKTASGMKFNSKLATAAYPDRQELGSIVVVSYRGQNRAVAATDIGPAKFLTKQPYNRGIDLSAAAYDSFGQRCDFDGPLKDVTIYACPMTPSGQAVAKK